MPRLTEREKISRAVERDMLRDKYRAVLKQKRIVARLSTKTKQAREAEEKARNDLIDAEYWLGIQIGITKDDIVRKIIKR
jgi:hypothetical protein